MHGARDGELQRDELDAVDARLVRVRVRVRVRDRVTVTVTVRVRVRASARLTCRGFSMKGCCASTWLG